MTRLHVGALLDRLPSRRYGEKLAFCEYLPRAPWPRASTLKRWFFQRSHDVQVGLVAPKASFIHEGRLHLAAMPRDAFDWLVAASRTLQVAYTVIPTGREVTPGARDRARLEEYCRALAEQSERPVVWAPLGMWEPEAALQQAKRMGTGLALDVLEQDPLTADVAYARVSAVGGRARLGRGHLELALQALLATQPQTAFLSIDADGATAKAVATLNAARELAGDAAELEVVEPAPLARA